MILINKFAKLSSHMELMSISDRPLVKQTMLMGLSSAMVLIQYIFQTTATLLAALSASAKTNFLWNSWTPFVKFLNVNLGLGGGSKFTGVESY